MAPGMGRQSKPNQSVPKTIAQLPQIWAGTDFLVFPKICDTVESMVPGYLLHALEFKAFVIAVINVLNSTQHSFAQVSHKYIHPIPLPEPPVNALDLVYPHSYRNNILAYHTYAIPYSLPTHENTIETHFTGRNSQMTNVDDPNTHPHV